MDESEKDDFQKIRQVILIEQFKNCLFTDLSTHLDDKNVSSINEAAVMSDSYALTHKRNFIKQRQGYGHNSAPNNAPQVTPTSIERKEERGNDGEKNNSLRNKERSAADRGSGRFHNTLPKQPAITCGYCKKQGHTMQECWKLKNKNEGNNPVGFISSSEQDQNQNYSKIPNIRQSIENIMVML